MFGLVLLALALTALSLLFLLGNWIGVTLLAAILGVIHALFWAIKNVQGTVEYWRGTCPGWVHFLFGHPDILKKFFSPSVEHFIMKLGKPFYWLYFIVFTPFWVWVLANIHLILAVVFIIIWLLGVLLSELYFKRRFTRIKDWSEILNSQD